MRPPVVRSDGCRILVEWSGETRICDSFSAEMARCGADPDRIAIDAWERGSPLQEDSRWERVGEYRMEECAPGIYVTAPGREMDPACRTALLYALGGSPWKAVSP